MIYTLEWQDDARNEMQSILDTHRHDLANIKDAYQILVHTLPVKAHSYGESRLPEVEVLDEDVRIAFFPPLVVVFEFDAEHKHVRILSVYYRKAK